MQTIDQICAGLSPERHTRVSEELAQTDHTDMPWYLRIIIAIGAWLAAFFFVSCGLEFFGWQPEHKQAIGVTGLVLLVAAIIVNRLKLGLFVEQCALALSLAGQGMIYYGFTPDSNGGAALAGISTVLALSLYFLYPSFLSRLITCAAALQITVWWLHTRHEDWIPWVESVGSPFSPPLFLFWLFHLALLVICLLPARLDRFLSPLGHAAAFSLACWQAADLFTSAPVFAEGMTKASGSLAFFPWRAILTAIVLLAVAFWSAGSLSRLKQRRILFAALMATLFVLVLLGSTGVLVALLLMLIGFSLQKRPILVLGLILLPIFLVDYYYSLDVSLLAKSEILVGSGAAILALRTALMKFAFNEEVA